MPYGEIQVYKQIQFRTFGACLDWSEAWLNIPTIHKVRKYLPISARGLYLANSKTMTFWYYRIIRLSCDRKSSSDIFWFTRNQLIKIKTLVWNNFQWKSIADMASKRKCVVIFYMGICAAVRKCLGGSR